LSLSGLWADCSRVDPCYLHRYSCPQIWGQVPGASATAENRHLVLRSACFLATRQQRGSNESTNGLLRQFCSKGTDLSNISQTELNDVARLMNQRPRKTLGWKTPEEAMTEELDAFRSNVALEA